MGVTRREVLSTGARAGALAVAVSAAAGRAAARPPGVRRPLPRPEAAAWRELRRRLGPGADLYLPGNPGFPLLAPPDNLRYAGVVPAGIAACATEADVRAALCWAVSQGMPFAARSGGHNYAGYSTTRGLLISLRRIRGVTPAGNRLVLGGGATNSDVYAARSANLYFPGGRCGGVGVAGLALGGGLGFNDRKWGLTCDRLAETRVLLADGSLVRASADENADLFWACRGGAGGNFGINTAFTFDSVPVGDRRAAVFDLAFDLDDAVRLMALVQEILAHDDGNDFDVRIGFKNPGDGSAGAVALLGHRLGDEQALRRVLAPVLEIGPRRSFIQERQFWSAQDYLMEQPGEGYASASKSLVPDRWLDERSVASITRWVRHWRPGAAGNPGYVTLFAMGGAASRPTAADAAYAHRRGTFVIDIGTHWAPGAPQALIEGQLAQTRAMHATLGRELGTAAAYVNFPDPDLRGWQWAYYGANYDRLARVKRRYDPSGVFRYDQAIGG